MNTIKEWQPTSNKESRSVCKDYIGKIILDRNNRLCEGEKILPNGTVVRFVNGLIDGNIYDENGKSILQRPAVEYTRGGQEFWTKGYPDGYPAVSQNMGYYEEDWADKQILTVREEQVLEKIDFFE